MRFVGPGHTPVIFAGTSLVEFSPTDRFNQTMEVVTKNNGSCTGRLIWSLVPLRRERSIQLLG